MWLPHSIDYRDYVSSSKSILIVQYLMYIYVIFCKPLQALQYLRKLCNHPALVVNADHPMYDSVQQYLESNSTTLTDIRHAAKLTALKLVEFK